MTENKAFQLAVLASIIIHSVLFLGIQGMPFLPSKQPPNNIKVTYYKIKETPEKKVIARKVEPILKKLPDIKKEEILNPPKTIAKKAVKPKAESKPVITAKAAEEKIFEKVVEEEKDDAKRATYISYYHAVREKIRRYADRNYPRNRNLGRGEVFLSFVVASSGELLQVSVVDRKSLNNITLRKLAINSIRDASPFPPFPKGMGQYQITFNIAISFESQ